MFYDLCKILFWVLFISWWQLPFYILSYIAGTIWSALRMGWKDGGELY